MYHIIRFTMKREYPIKVCFVGDPAVGKTSIIAKYVKNQFDEEYLVTMGVSITSKRVEFEKFDVVLTTFDLAGQKEFLFQNKLFFEGASAIVFVYDISRRETLYHVPDWFDIYKKSNSYKTGDASIFLIGCKQDLEDKRQVSIDEAKEFGEELGIKNIFEVSAKTGYNIDVLFEKIITEYIRYRLNKIKNGKAA